MLVGGLGVTLNKTPWEEDNATNAGWNPSNVDVSFLIKELSLNNNMQTQNGIPHT